MKFARIAGILGLCTLVLAPGALAQGGPTRMQRDRRPNGQSFIQQFDQFHLTPHQKAKVEAMGRHFSKEATALKENKSLSAEQRSEALMKIGLEQSSDFQSILNPAQRKQFDKMVSANSTPALQKALIQYRMLHLTPAQQLQMFDINQSSAKKMTAVLADKSLTEPQRQQKIIQVGQEITRRQHALLTPTQRKQWDQDVAKQAAQIQHPSPGR